MVISLLYDHTRKRRSNFKWETRARGWGHLETKALYMVSQEIERELALAHQREDEEQLDLLLDQQIGSLDLELENQR